MGMAGHPWMYMAMKIILDGCSHENDFWMGVANHNPQNSVTQI